MNNHDSIPPEDLALWQQWRDLPHDEVTSASADCPPALDLAAYIDGRGDASLNARIESHVNSCADCQEALADVRVAHESIGENLAFIQPQALERAKSLVPPGKPEIVVTRRLTVSRAIRNGVGWGLAAAAAIGVAIGGYQLGQASGPSESLSEDAVLAAMSFGLINDSSSDNGTMILLTSNTAATSTGEQR